MTRKRPFRGGLSAPQVIRFPAPDPAPAVDPRRPVPELPPRRRPTSAQHALDLAFVIRVFGVSLEMRRKWGSRPGEPTTEKGSS